MPRKKKTDALTAAGPQEEMAPSVAVALLPEHSPLGASSAERWMNCPGSVALIHAVKTGEQREEEDPDYRRDGVQAHALAAWCLNHDADAWEGMGSIEGNELTQDMMSAVQVYLDFVRKLPGERYIEERMHRPEFHASAFGTMDFAAVMRTKDEADFVDYKHGEGIFVPVERNPQFMYYVFLFIGDNRAEYPDDMTTRIHVVQPRCPGGPTRSWPTTAGDIRNWAWLELRPAMEATAKDRYLSVGDWCRFCPAKLVCPAMTNLADEFTYYRKQPLKAMPHELIGDFYQKWQWLKMFGKNLEAETARRVLGGDVVPGVKAVQKRANRVWKEGAEEQAKEKYGGLVYNVPSFVGPPAVETLPNGKEFVAEWAFSPDTGLTIALESDPKPAVSVSPEAKYGDPKKLLDGAA